MKLLVTTLALISLTSPAWAYSEQHDEYSLDLKGFSPEMVQAAEAMISRQEGRYPLTTPEPKKQMLINLKNNNWIDTLQPWTYDRVEAPPYPKRPE